MTSTTATTTKKPYPTSLMRHQRSRPRMGLPPSTNAALSLVLLFASALAEITCAARTHGNGPTGVADHVPRHVPRARENIWLNTEPAGELTPGATSEESKRKSRPTLRSCLFQCCAAVVRVKSIVFPRWWRW